MKKVFNAWNGFVGEINSSVSEKEAKTYSVLYIIVAIFMAIAGKKNNKLYFIGSAIYAVLAAAFFKSYKTQRRERERWERKKIKRAC